MYVTTKLSTNRRSRYIQVIRAYRDNFGKSRQQVIKHIGTSSVDDLDKIDTLKNQARLFIQEYEEANLEQQKQIVRNKSTFKTLYSYPIEGNKYPVPSSDKISTTFMENTNVINVGFHDIFGNFYDKIGIANILKKEDDQEQRYFYSNILKNIVLARIAKPTSKRGSVKYIKDFFNIEIPLHHVYKMMDMLDENRCKEIQKCVYKYVKRITNKSINVALYDVTTLYFESFTEGELKKIGYSKDCKFNQPQILFSILTTEEGLPIGYKVFEGNTYEGHRLKDVLEEIIVEYKLNNITIVADSGILNKENIVYIKSKNFRYIFGSRIKNQKKEIEEQILQVEKYKNLRNDEGVKYIKIEEGKKADKDKQKDNKDKKYIIVTHSKKRSEKDKKDREKAIEKLMIKLRGSKNASSLISNYGYKKYLKIEGDHKVILKEEAISKESKWDGLHGVETNIENMSVEEVVKNYKSLWKIEECFRINKRDLSMRPIFHWTKKRIESHIGVVFISFCCANILLYILKKKGIIISLESLVNDLKQVNGNLIKETNQNKTYYLPVEISDETKKIYKALNIKPIDKIKRIKM